ncbi:MAG: SDR family NAD(P)-dependent oxidoreductase, partial [Gemmatimonadaceae bacterium]
VVLLARDRERGEHALRDVRRETGNDQVSLELVDLASFASVRAVAARLSERFPAVNVLVNNAGVNLLRRTLTVDGMEMTLAVNHLAPFLLTNLLLPVLRAGAPSRVVNVTSRFERWGRIAFHDLQLTSGYTALRAYTQSKLATLLFTYALAARTRQLGVAVNAVHPGLAATDLMRDLPRWLRSLYEPFLLSPEAGARPLIALASSPSFEGVTGLYFERQHERRSSRRSYDEEAGERLWQMSEELTGAALPW